MTKVILADDHVIVRQGLRALLDNHADMEVVADVGNGRDAVAAVKQHQPDIAVIDVAMPEMNGVEATRIIISNSQGQTQVIGLSMHEDRRFALRMLQAGARGYLLKEAAFTELVDAINAVRRGRIYLGGRMADSVLDAVVNNRHETEGAMALTQREREVLQLVAEGHTTREISELLDLSGKTVETYRKRLMEKLNAHSIAELTKIAVREGITGV
jgi:DNA-binding NarL/FixJ family response regulator